MEKGNLKFWKQFTKLSILQRKINISNDVGIPSTKYVSVDTKNSKVSSQLEILST